MWWVPILWGLGIGGAAVTAGSYVSSSMAASEAEKHTGGTYTLDDGTEISADEMHRRLCAAGLLDAETCAQSPSEVGMEAADLPEGFVEHAVQPWVGAEGRHVLMGDCEAKDAKGQPLNPHCPRAPKGIPGWVFAAIGVTAIAFVFMPTKKA